jgi:pimeloyl-ACP methyl ester carboxylesterase
MPSGAPDQGRSIFVSAPDGLRLHVRAYGAPNASGLPVVCLPGLTRTVADFESLAPALASTRRVFAIDSRGRGQSDYDPNPENYNVAVELNDVVSVLTALGIGPAVFVGSSRGGILTMLLAATRPLAVAGAVLHDIGPVIEPEGLARIKSYVGTLSSPGSLAEGAQILRRLFQVQFPKLTDKQWSAMAGRVWKLERGALVSTYDVRLAQPFADDEQPVPELWTEFDALAQVPVLVIRGANSDILSAGTVAAMRARHPGLESVEIPDQGHVPLLEGTELLSRIERFAERCESAQRNEITGLDALLRP